MENESTEDASYDDVDLLLWKLRFMPKDEAYETLEQMLIKCYQREFGSYENMDNVHAEAGKILEDNGDNLRLALKKIYSDRYRYRHNQNTLFLSDLKECVKNLNLNYKIWF